MKTKSIVWNTGSGNITLTYQGQGDGPITVQSDPNVLGTSRSQIITVETVGGAITKNLTVSQAACPVPVGTVLTYSYTGTYQEVTLPAGQYKLQCWGAQGGSNAAASTYGITAQAGGKGGYSEGVLTLSQNTTLYIFVGGQGSSTGNGGWNGGGGCENSYSQYDSNGIFGTSRFGCGGGATDIALTTSSMSYSSYRTNRSSASLLSRMIVAGGGSGGAMAYKKTSGSSTSKTMSWGTNGNWGSSSTSSSNIYWRSSTGGFTATKNAAWAGHNTYVYINPSYFPCTLTFSYTITGSVISDAGIYPYDNAELVPWALSNRKYVISGTSGSASISLTDSSKPYLGFYCNDLTVGSTIKVTNTKITYTTSDTIERDYHAGWPGGGTTGCGYYSHEKGTQTTAGGGGSPTADFGNGAVQDALNWRFVPGAGGGGWYGGGTNKFDSDLDCVKRSGGGSGWVNTPENASNRPSGYTGLQLDSGTTYAGDTSFPNTAGTGNETGHSGNGYAKITRLS